MKRFLLIIVTVLIAATAIHAQKKIDPAKAQEIFNAKVKYMQEQLLLTDEQTEKFIPIYKDYLTEVRSIKCPAHPKKDEEVKTTEEAAEIVVARISFHRSVLDAQERCVLRLKDVLTAPQLLKFLKTERSMQSKIKNFKDGKPGKRHHKHGNKPQGPAPRSAK